MIRRRYIVIWVLMAIVGLNGIISGYEPLWEPVVVILIALLGASLHTIDSRLRANHDTE